MDTRVLKGIHSPHPTGSVFGVTIPGPTTPIVSVVMANYNGARYIEEAVASVLRQTLGDLELLVGDDASTDDSAERVAAIASRDPRVRLIRSTANLGPAGARNLCLHAARGRWIAIVDNDDTIHPDRFARLVAAAEKDGSDIVADDLLIFSDNPAMVPTACLRGAWARAPFQIDAATYIRGNTLFSGAQALGYLKPIIRAKLLADASARYDTTLRIGEDYDLIVRLLLRGASFRVHPLLLYFYRKHQHSISHRLSRATLEPLLAAQDRLAEDVRGHDQAVDAAMSARRASLRKALAFEDLVLALKQRDWRAAGRLILQAPGTAFLLRQPLTDRIRRLRHAAVRSTPNRRQVCVLSRQRIVGATNGSSAYLLGICEALRDSGCDVHLVWPSPTVFGRWPWLSRRPEMTVFASIALRGGMRAGRFLIATDPRVAIRAFTTVAARGLSRFGLRLDRLDQQAPYAIGEAWQRDDMLFVAQHTPRPADIVVADYAFLTEGIPYTLSARAASAVVMHDLFSSRGEQFDRLGTPDSVLGIDRTSEMALLGKANIVVAIQETEASIVRSHLPDRHVVTAPMAVRPVQWPQPGSEPVVLFVGSNTAPNIVGLKWFVDSVWPKIQSDVPQARLRVAGSVRAGVADPPDGVALLGVVPDLDEEYSRAAVVVSPLLAGSGLKIKLIEALGHGKAIVATTVTMQGVEALAGDAVEVADDADEFSAAVVALLRDRERRAARAAAALTIARRHFSPTACYDGLLRLLLSERASTPSPPAVDRRDATAI